MDKNNNTRKHRNLTLSDKHWAMADKASKEHKPALSKSRWVEASIEEKAEKQLEDAHDTKEASKVLKRIKSGKEKVVELTKGIEND